jgi:serine/threonine-protein kinase
MTHGKRFVGPYRLERKLARGGMAEVFVATRLGAAGFEKRVCLKTILPAYAADPEFRDLFVGEASLAGKLCHVNLVQVFDCIQDGETLALVMELVDGLDLRVLVKVLRAREQVLPREVVAHVAGQILAGLAYAHDRKVVHRDISPHNVLVSRHGEVKIGDFGVAKLMLSLGARTNTIRGKIPYMSPEQASSGRVDHRTDLYSAGLVLYELVTGRCYYRHPSRSDVTERIAGATSRRLEDAGVALGAVLERLLALRPEDRFASAREALDALPPWRSLGPAGAEGLAEVVRDVLSSEVEGGSTDAPDALRTSRDASNDDAHAVSQATATTPDPPAGAEPVDRRSLLEELDAAFEPARDTVSMPVLDCSVNGSGTQPASRGRLVLFAGALLALLTSGLCVGVCARIAIELASSAGLWP